MRIAGALTEVRVLGRSFLMRSCVLDCLSNATIYLMVQCLRFVSLDKQTKCRKDEGKRKIYETSCNLCSIFSRWPWGVSNASHVFSQFSHSALQTEPK